MRVNYNGHEIDLFISPCGYIAYVDADLEPQTISEEEYYEYASKGEFVSF